MPFENEAFAPPPPVDVIPNPTPEQQADLAGQWRGFIHDPGNRAALLQCGGAMLQPIGVGQTPVGQIGQSIGAAGEAQDRVTGQQIREQEVADKGALRQAQAESTWARGEAALSTAAARSENAATRASAATERLGLTRELGQLRANVSLNAQYNKFVEDLQLIQPTASVPSFEEWVSKNPQLAAALGSSGESRTNAESPPAKYPDAKKAPDGNWYVQKSGKYYKVQQ